MLFDSLEYLFSSIHLKLLLEPLKLFFYSFLKAYDILICPDGWYKVFM